MPAGRRPVRLLKWTEGLLLVGGAAALVWCALVIAEAHLVEHQARRWLQASGVRSAEPAGSSATLESTEPAGPVVSGGPVAPGQSRAYRGDAPWGAAAPMAASVNHGAVLSTRTPLAELSIPRVRLSAVVFHGSDTRTLRVGLGHIENTPLPGEAGNVAIAGHRDSFFRELRNIAVGDDILMSTPREHLHYRVSSFRVVQSDDVSVLAPTEGSTLTLITCYPFWFIGQAPDRFVVRAVQVRDSEQVALESHTRTSNRSGSAIVGGGLEPSGRERATSNQGPATSRVPDDVLVREAVERFRQIYNGRSASRWAAQASGPLTFLTCRVTADGGRATASCQSVPVSNGHQEPLLWSFNLRVEAGRWAIQDVTTQ